MGLRSTYPGPWTHYWFPPTASRAAHKGPHNSKKEEGKAGPVQPPVKKELSSDGTGCSDEEDPAPEKDEEDFLLQTTSTHPTQEDVEMKLSEESCDNVCSCHGGRMKFRG